VNPANSKILSLQDLHSVWPAGDKNEFFKSVNSAQAVIGPVAHHPLWVQGRPDIIHNHAIPLVEDEGVRPVDGDAGKTRIAPRVDLRSDSHIPWILYVNDFESIAAVRDECVPAIDGYIKRIKCRQVAVRSRIS
jgi:hypothetical protein